MSTSAPNSFASARRSSLVSSAITRAPIASGELRRREPDRTLAEYRDRVVALQAEPVQRTPGRAGSA